LARYDHLPIFADAYRLALQVEQEGGRFSNRQRPSIGADLRLQCGTMLHLIIRVNSQTERRAGLEELRTAVEEFLVVARLGRRRPMQWQDVRRVERVARARL
jgi:hypothetical protein